MATIRSCMDKGAIARRATVAVVRSGGAPSTAAWEDGAATSCGHRNPALGWVMSSDTQKAHDDAASRWRSGRPESRQRHTTTDGFANQLDSHVESDC